MTRDVFAKATLRIAKKEREEYKDDELKVAYYDGYIKALTECINFYEEKIEEEIRMV